MSLPNLSLFFIMVCFWVTFFLVDRFLIKPILRVLDERHGRIRGAQDEWAARNEEYLSATARLEAAVEDAAREGAKRRAELREQAQAQRQELLERAGEQANASLEKALSELDRDAKAARDELRERAQELARLFAGQLLQREVAS
jgi:F-type H+-transporting ATPase subunit b